MAAACVPGGGEGGDGVQRTLTAHGVDIGAFGAKIPATLQCSSLIDSPVRLASMGDVRRKSLNTKIEPYSDEPASK